MNEVAKRKRVSATTRDVSDARIQEVTPYARGPVCALPGRAHVLLEALRPHLVHFPLEIEGEGEVLAA